MDDCISWEEIISTLSMDKQEQVRQNLADLLREYAMKQIKIDHIQAEMKNK